MDIDQIAELDRLFAHLDEVSHSLERLYINIDNYDRQAAAAIIATNTGMVRGVAQRLTELLTELKG